jgi:sugar lactone lactonase YvrE
VNSPDVVGLAFDSKGNLFATDSGNGRILKFTPGGVRDFFAQGLTNPAGLAIDKGGNVFVTSPSGTITKITPAGTKTPFASGLSKPTGLAFDTAGNLYEADQGSGTVFKFTPAGTKTLFASGFTSPNGPFGLAFDGKGNLFVSDLVGQTITKIAPNGTKTPFASGIRSPKGIAFDSSGNLLVANAGPPSAILLFTPAGTKGTFADGGGAGVGEPQFLAFEPVLHTLLNLSNRGFVETGDSALFAGFILGGNGAVDCTIVVRGIGPSLTPFGVPDALNDPVIEVRDAAGALLGSNNDWQTAQESQIQATGLAPTNNKESAILMTLPAGQYTAIIRGVDNAVGNAVVEVFNLQ